MCGRYAFYQRASEVRQQLEEHNLPVDQCPDDDQCRQTYNFPPGAIGIVYRPDVPDYGAGPSTKHARNGSKGNAEDKSESIADINYPNQEVCKDARPSPKESQTEAKYILQPMKWGLVPSWTKRAPDYSSVMRTINARDDSLIDNKGIWDVPKRRKRCIVVAQGFYEWLKKNDGKDRIPHYIKRKDNQLMMMAGLWDCVTYEDGDNKEKSYTYTIITTDSNKQLKFLHDRMPVILDSDSAAVKTWLDPQRYEWTDDLQSLLKPFSGELDIYQVNKDVGKVGNDSPSFIIPIDSKANKSNIANFFGNQAKISKPLEAKTNVVKAGNDVQKDDTLVKQKNEEHRATTLNTATSESNAPMPVSPKGIKREHSEDEDSPGRSPEKKIPKLDKEKSPVKTPAKPIRQMKSATSNGSASKKGSPNKAAQGTPKITSFFKK